MTLSRHEHIITTMNAEERTVNFCHGHFVDVNKHRAPGQERMQWRKLVQVAQNYIDYAPQL